MSKLLTIAESALYLRIGRSTLQRLIDSGRLPSVTIMVGRRKRLQRIAESDLQAFVESLKTTAKPAPLRIAKGA